MVKLMERASDRLLHLFAPKIDAVAAPRYCGPWGAVCISCSGVCGARLYRFRECWTAGGPVVRRCESYSGCPC